MDGERDKQKTMEVVDTSDQPTEGGQVVKETVAEHLPLYLRTTQPKSSAPAGWRPRASLWMIPRPP